MLIIVSERPIQKTSRGVKMGDGLKVLLGGHTVDADVIRQTKEGITKLAAVLAEMDNLPPNKRQEMFYDLVNAAKSFEGLTPDSYSPECTAAAYLRVSKDPESLPELRARARLDVEKARKSASSIFFKESHKAGGNLLTIQFDVLNIPRLDVEYLEARRLAGYLEKSQRYVMMEGDFYLPAEYSEEDAADFISLVDLQNRFYLRNIESLIEYQYRMNPELAKAAKAATERGVPDAMNKKKNRIEGLGKEDARYSLGLSTLTQVGTAFDATSLEHAIRRMKYAELAGVRDLATQLFNIGKDVAPSFILYSDPDEFEQRFKEKLEDQNFSDTPVQTKKAVDEAIAWARKDPDYCPAIFKRKGDVTLVTSNDMDLNVIAATIHSYSRLPVEECYRVATQVRYTPNQAMKFFKDLLANVGKWDNPGREFEVTGLMFEIILSSSAFAQLKRHRMMTLLSQNYDASLGITVPDSIREIGLEPKLREICDRSTELYLKFLPKYGTAAEYCLTNAHKRRTFVATNLREENHIARHRCDEYAQWDINRVAHDMLELAREVAPLSLLTSCGKSEYASVREKVYGK
jgi:thymidylate synthase ThyX